MKQAGVIVLHFLLWFVVAFGVYAFFITSMAEALGIPGREWQSADYMEGIAISLGAAGVLTVISLSVTRLINSMRH